MPFEGNGLFERVETREASSLYLRRLSCCVNSFGVRLKKDGGVFTPTPHPLRVPGFGLIQYDRTLGVSPSVVSQRIA